MTVCVAVKVRDCIVFAADSAVSIAISQPGGVSAVSNVWKHGLKVFNLHRNLPIMAMTAGLGNFGSMSISSLAKEFRIELMGKLDENNFSIKEVADHAQQYIHAEYKKIHAKLDRRHSFEFWIGGYGHENKHGEIWKIEIRNGQLLEPAQLATPMKNGTLQWGGQVQAIYRLLVGFDPEVHSILRKQNLDLDQLRSIDSKLGELKTPLVHPSMPVQDAIDLADFLVDMTKRYVAFLPGADTVGGDTDIATVTKYEGFKWIRRKHYYPAHLNRRTTDHVK